MNNKLINDKKKLLYLSFTEKKSEKNWNHLAGVGSTFAVNGSADPDQNEVDPQRIMYIYKLYT